MVHKNVSGTSDSFSVWTLVREDSDTDFGNVLPVHPFGSMTSNLIKTKKPTSSFTISVQ